MRFDPTEGVVPAGWTVGTIGDACDAGTGDVQTGPFGSQLHASDYVPVGIPSIMPQDLKEDRVSTESIARIRSSDAERLAKYRVAPGDIVYSRRGDVERRALITEREAGWLCGTGCLRVRLGNAGLDPTFFYYHLGHPAVRGWIVRHAQGATMPNLNTSILRAVPLCYPPLDEQRRIAAVLGALDDKIELNRKMNRTLEEMAQAIFKSWFIDFDGHDDLVDSEIGPVPRGWGVARAAEVADVSIGKTPPRKEPHWFSTNPGDVRWMSIKDLGACGAYITQTAEYLTAEAVERHRVKRIPDNTVVLSFKLTVGRVAITEGEMCSNEAIAHFRLPEGTPLSSEYLYSYLKSFRYDDLGSTSSIATAVNSKVIQAMPVLVPARAAVARFDAAVQPIFRKLKCLAHESRTLADLRDALLPKLISGELRVPEAEELVEAAS